MKSCTDMWLSVSESPMYNFIHLYLELILDQQGQCHRGGKGVAAPLSFPKKMKNKKERGKNHEKIRKKITKSKN